MTCLGCLGDGRIDLNTNDVAGLDAGQ